MSTITIAGLCVLFGVTGPQPKPDYVPVPPGLVDREDVARRMDTYQRLLHHYRTQRERYEQRNDGADHTEQIQRLKREELRVQGMIASAEESLKPKPWMPVMPPARLPGARHRPKVWD
ncbi:hypothetical protein R5W24_003410 [Gemmata sp. JC717]|uniref:Uncharacterized protein n=1 Tax=Gemmata algarum TaxID=2975278 RepID=A0ABU5EV44_9BACT|nr:hypothetical protein [Gemmata algarum]MDY3554291.1 hypothetical protein [Gemmata algarum]MDY3559060.1 hypothetical protein [Gemmata algarum]